MKCCDITPAMLREPVTFERLTRNADGAGGYAETWQPINSAPARAMVKAMSGGERWASQRVEASASWRVTVRYFADLRESDRVIIRGRAANIRFINNVELRNRWLVLDVDLGVVSA